MVHADVPDIAVIRIGETYYMSSTTMGAELNMAHTIPHFIGYCFGLSGFATKAPGGLVDSDHFHIAEQLTKKRK